MLKITILIVCFASINFVFGDGNCAERMKNLPPMSKCCKEPELFDEKQFESMFQELKKKFESNPNLLHCMTEQEAMKKLGLEKIDKEQYKKFIQKLVKEPWLSVMEKSIDICIDKIPEYESIYQKQYNFTKDQCNTQYCFLLDCFEVVDFLNCPADNWTKSDQCLAAKQFVVDCKTDDSLHDYIHMED